MHHFLSFTNSNDVDTDEVCVAIDHIVAVVRHADGSVMVTIDVALPGQGNQTDPGRFTFDPGPEADKFWQAAQLRTALTYAADAWTE